MSKIRNSISYHWFDIPKGYARAIQRLKNKPLVKKMYKLSPIIRVVHEMSVHLYIRHKSTLIQRPCCVTQKAVEKQKGRV